MTSTIPLPVVPAAPARSTTRVVLRRLRVALLAVTVAVLVTSWTAALGVQGTVGTVRTRTVPAVIEVGETREALVVADAAAIDSFLTGEARLAGPGVRYQNQIAVASRSLAQVAEDNAAGSSGSQRIQLVEGLLVSYLSQMEQADAHYRRGDAAGAALGLAHLWYASRLLHTGILVQLDQLREDQHAALDRQLSSGWLSGPTVLSWAVPMLALAVLLGSTQIWLARRFRRLLSPPLVAATVLLAVFAAGPAAGEVAEHRLAAIPPTLAQLDTQWADRVAAIDQRGQQALADLLTQQCADGCGDTVNAFIAALPAPGPQRPRPTPLITQVGAQAAGADELARTEPVMPVAAVLIAALILLGLQPRIEEYRYRSR